MTNDNNLITVQKESEVSILKKAAQEYNDAKIEEQAAKDLIATICETAAEKIVGGDFNDKDVKREVSVKKALLKKQFQLWFEHEYKRETFDKKEAVAEEQFEVVRLLAG